MATRNFRFGPTQKDIARALNVSQACVAIALNPASKGRERIPPHTVALIKAKAKELNYRPQRQARILRSGRSHTLGAVFNTGIYHAPQERVRHLARSAIQADYQLVSVDMDWFNHDIAAAQDYLLGMAAEGIVFCNIPVPEQRAWRAFMHERFLPVVSMNGAPDEVDQIRADMYSAFRDMTLHHLEQGSRHLHLLLSCRNMVVEKASTLLAPNQSAKIQGFMDAIRSVNGEINADMETCRIIGLPEDYTRSSGADIQGRIHIPPQTELYEDVVDLGYFEAKRILQNAKNTPDSFICSSDHIAAGVVAACGEVGMRIPEAVRISGSDNAPVSRYRGVQLTTIEQPSRLMAEWSIQRIVELIEKPGEHKSPKQEFLPCELIFRSSSTPDLIDLILPEDNRNHINSGAEKQTGHSIPSRPSNGAFSIMEILLVMGLVALLALLISPIFNHLLQAAGKAGCMNNLRALSIAVTNYAADNHGYLPLNDVPRDPSKPNSNLIKWMEVLAPYFGLEWKEVSKSEKVKKTPFVCPAEKDLDLGNLPHYAMNIDLNFRLQGEKAKIRLQTLENASRYVILSDSFASYILYTNTKERMEEWTRVTRRHDGAPHFLFADGHVEHFQRELQGYNDSAGKTDFFRNLWFANGLSPSQR